MAWNKLPKSQPTRSGLDPIDQQAEREVFAMRNANHQTGATAKRIAQQRRLHDRGSAIIENRAIGRTDLS